VDFVLEPEELKTLVQSVRDAEGDAFVDKWLVLVEKTRNEMWLENEFWAFLNGYSILKMNQLLEAQASIVSTTFQSFIELQERLQAIAAKEAASKGVVAAKSKKPTDMERLIESKSLT